MPTTTPKLGIEKPLGNETVNRNVINLNYDKIDENAAAQSQVDEPFYLKSAVYDAGNNKIDLTFGPGKASFLGTLVSKTADFSYSINSPTSNTTYYVFIKNDGSCTHNTTGEAITGAALIWKVINGVSVENITTEDVRGRLPDASARAVQDNLESHAGSGDNAHALATQSTAGFMSAADKTNLTNHLGSGGTAHATATQSTAGFMSAADKTILDLLASANVTNYNLSFEYDSDADGVPDGWNWVNFPNGTCEMDTSAVEGTYCVKITHPGGSGSGGGHLTSGFIPIQRQVNNYFIQFALWSSVAGIRNDIVLLFYDSNKAYISSVSVYSSTSNPTSAALFITQIPSIPSNSKWCKIRLYGGHDAVATGGTTRFDCISLYNMFHLTGNNAGTVPTFPERAKASDINFTDAEANLYVRSNKGFRLGYMPCTISLTVKGGSTGIGAEFRLRCGSEYGDYYFLATTNYQYVDVPLSITIADPSSPIMLAVQYRTRGTDWVGVKRESTSATISVVNNW
jgi:hypothetical protein